MMARARQTAPPAVVASADAGIGAAFQSMLAAVARPFNDSPSTNAAVAAPAASQSAPVVPPLEAPLPPRRPSEIGGIEVAALSPKPEAPVPVPIAVSRPVAALRSAPIPVVLPMPGLPKLITGAQPVLPAGVFAYAPWPR
jgi:hypothetical protein